MSIYCTKLNNHVRSAVDMLILNLNMEHKFTTKYTSQTADVYLNFRKLKSHYYFIFSKINFIFKKNKN